MTATRLISILLCMTVFSFGCEDDESTNAPPVNFGMGGNAGEMMGTAGLPGTAGNDALCQMQASPVLALRGRPVTSTQTAHQDSVARMDPVEKTSVWRPAIWVSRAPPGVHVMRMDCAPQAIRRSPVRRPTRPRHHLSAPHWTVVPGLYSVFRIAEVKTSIANKPALIRPMKRAGCSTWPQPSAFATQDVLAMTTIASTRHVQTKSMPALQRPNLSRSPNLNLSPSTRRSSWLR